MDLRIPRIKAKETTVESVENHEESDNWNQRFGWGISAGTEWIGGAGESGDNARWIKWRKWISESNELCKPDKY